MPVTRLLVPNDSAVLAELLRGNRAFLAPWQPRRGEEYFSDEGQREAVRKALEQYDAGSSMPLVILDKEERVVGTVTIQSIIRGFFQSCSVGYWLAESAQGRGLATTALREATRIAFHELRLHRVQAETLPHNVRSQRVLDRLGFVNYGIAPAYLKLGGSWQDNMLYQLLTPVPDLVAVPD
ncbi:MAG: GNAT family N-acetyltransferase [Actinomycetota bacterium]|nr:GNAT family N-acetyltransferase [Actinomycetota bacterium]